MPPSQSAEIHLAKNCVDRSERFQGTGSELHNIREALRCLISHAEIQQETINRLLAESHRLNPMEPLG
jgi:hypothetical protein